MGKPLSDEVVEYCYRTGYIVNQNKRYNIEIGEPPENEVTFKYKHVVIISYELKNAQGDSLKIVKEKHELDGLTDMDTNQQVQSKINANLNTWDLANKLKYSGYVPE